MTDPVWRAPSQRQAEKAIESLREGIPPAGHVRHFTVGRESELKRLEETLGSPDEGTGAALLVRANYGGGKTHLLNVIREMALETERAVAFVTMDSASGVRANRMDQVFGAVCRALEVPGATSGISGLFDRVIKKGPKGPHLKDWAKLSDGGQWAMSDYLDSPAIFIALRAWATTNGDLATRELVTDWLSFPDDYKSDRKRLFNDLVNRLRGTFYDPRPEYQFYKDGYFTFRERGYEQSWDALDDLDKLAKVAGLRGLVLLFDEFEDVVHNLNNRTYQQTAFVNLFRFFDGHRFPGMTYFAVTPDFSAMCKDELMSRQVYGFPVSRFDKLKHFEMSRIHAVELRDLARRIRGVHAVAYEWDADEEMDDSDIEELIAQLARRSTQDQTRQAIIGIVEHLDELLNEVG
ncbi:MAG: DUF2791 family P-loop domain-containing protein [Microbacteriaceae bacterium]|nr:DUF2791 family P-loop domain-containing protein [Microbacteriaceae bacterium]